MKKTKKKDFDMINVKNNGSLNNKIVFILFTVIFVILYWDFFFYPAASADSISQFFPMGTFNKQFFIKHFSLPLWNPYINCGYPNLDYGFYYNIVFLFAYILPIQFGVSICYAFITLLGGIFAYIFFKSLQLNKYTAFFSALLFMIAGNMVSYVYPGHLGKPLVMALIPLIFFFINKGIDTEKIYHFVLAGFFLGFQFLGHPQIFYYSLMLTTLYFFLKMYWKFQENKNFRLVIKSFLFYGIIGLSALLICFNHLFLTLSFSQLTSRSASVSPQESWNFATSWSRHPIEILAFFIPSLFGLYDSTYLGWMPFVQTTDYIGFITIIIAIIGIITYWHKKEIKFITFFTLFTFLFSMGKHFPAFYKIFFNYFPMIKKFRVPSSIYLITSFCILFLFIYGFNALLKINKDFKTRKKIFIIILISLVLLISLTVFVNSNSYKDILKNNLGRRINLNTLYQKYPAQADQYVNNIISKPVEMSQGDLKLIWIFVGVFLIFIYLFDKKIINQKVFVIIVGAICVIDLFIVDKKFLKTIDNYDIVAKKTDVINVLQEFKKKNKQFRISPIPASINNESNKWMLYDIESAFGYNSLALSLYEDVMKTGWFNNLKLLGLMNVKYLLSKKVINNPDLELVYKGSKLIYENKKFLPRYLFFDKYKVLKGRDQVLRYMASPSYDPTKELILEEVPESIENYSIKGNKIQLLKWSYDKFSLKAEIQNKCLLFLSEVFYPKWQAFKDNKELKIYKANYLFRAVILPAGDYTITFEFHNNFFYVVSAIFHYLLTLFIFVWIFFLIRKKRI